MNPPATNPAHPARQRPGHPHRTAATPLVALTLILALTTGVVATATPARADDPLRKVDTAVIDATTAGRRTTFWALLRDRADLRPAATVTDRAARGAHVVNQLKQTADRSQKRLTALLTARGAPHQRFWITNAVKITAGAADLKKIAADPAVTRIRADRPHQIPTPRPNKPQPGVATTEWNLDHIRAPEVWSTFNIRGEGIVVANVDTGVQYDHPALVGQYRGNQGDGTFDHNYNWYDPSQYCGTPSTPCDNVDHGTHTMGTMVGDDGAPGPHQIGVAPRARWIAAKGCESTSCSTSSLLAAGQWILAPTDLNGDNPRPDLRPHIVNNSWGGDRDDPFYRDIVNAWLASGIFPTFSNGNNGPDCGTATSPGDYAQAYSTGAFDNTNTIAAFSSRGPATDGPKPDITAPGVAIRSSVPPGGYAVFDGTSMAAPHVSATVALMWSAAPALLGDIPATRAILDATAIDTEDLTCGGTPTRNNVWGEGRLDAYAAVETSPRGPTGTLTGTVTNATGGDPVSGATIRLTGPANRTVTTDPTGRYRVPLPAGTYQLTATAFGFQDRTITGVDIRDNATTVADVTLSPAPAHTLTGHVRDETGEPLAGATVTLPGTPLPPATTDSDGAYRVANLPPGQYDVRATADGCHAPQERSLTVDGDETLDFALPRHTDAYGYQCRLSTPAYVEADTLLPLNGDDGSTPVTLPFPFPFYGQTYPTAHVSTNGVLTFLAPDYSYADTPLPSPEAPNAAIYPFWDDLYVDDTGSLRTMLTGTAPTRAFVIEWRNVALLTDLSKRLDFEVLLHEDGRIQTEYRNIDPDDRERGASATIGIENDTGDTARQYAHHTPALDTPTFALRYQLPPHGTVEGTVTDANDGQPLAGATVRALRDDAVVRTTHTDQAGHYLLRLVPGTYTIEVAARNHRTDTTRIVIDEPDQTRTHDVALPAAQAEMTPTSLDLVVPPDQTRTRTVTLRNTGTLDLTWRLAETGGGREPAPSPAPTKKPGHDPNARTTRDVFATPPAAGVAPVAPAAPGDVIRSWPAAGLTPAWGVGYSGDVWLSDMSSKRNHEFSVTGTRTGRVWPSPGTGDWPGDMAYDVGRHLMCQVQIGGDNGIHCWNPDTGAELAAIIGGYPWTATSQRGLAYRPDDDTFYVGGWNDRTIYHIKGLSHPDKGQVISRCSPADGNISGLAWNAGAGVIWAATNSATDTIYQLDPTTCAVLDTLAHPSPGYHGAGLETDTDGNLWMVDTAANQVYLVDSGLPDTRDVPWLATRPAEGTLAPGTTRSIQVTVNTTGLTPGTYRAALFLRTNSGRTDQRYLPIRLVVPAYQQAVNAGGAAHTDRAGDRWAADQRHRAGSWGYLNRGSTTASTRRAIAATDDDPLYQDLRQDPVEYRFDGLPAGVYEIDLRFAEITNRRPNTRLYDVIAENQLLLPAHDTAGEAGTFTADQHAFHIRVTDGQLNLRFVTRTGYGTPAVNAIRVTHRPDR